MDTWDLEPSEPAFVELADDGTGRFGFAAVTGWMDCRWSERDGRPFVEFSWDGNDEEAQASGRGWAVLGEDGTLSGHLFFHMGDDSRFRAVRA